MELLTVRNLAIERSGRPLLSEGDFTLREGMRLGLIGANGSGKSALLEVLAGVRPPTSGRVQRAPGVALGYLPQRTDWDESLNAWEAALLGLSRNSQLERELREQEELLSRGEGSLERYGDLREAFERAGGYAAEAVLRESLAALGIGEEQLGLAIADLSGGERARLALARAVAAEPPLLLLDEPSNHLDLPALGWLGERLGRWRGALLLVSHDRALLDRVSTHTAELQDGRISISRGGYSRLREQQGIIRRAGERRERERRKEAARLEGIAQELRSWGTVKAQRRRRRAERELDELGPTPGRPRRERLPASDVREVAGKLLGARHLSSVRGDRRVLEDIHLSIEAGDRIALLGANGSGKSTLLRLLAGDLPSDDPRVEFWWNRDLKLLHAGQHDRGLHDDRPVQEQLEELVTAERARMLLMLGGLPQETWRRLPDTLSGGERARAGLARLIASQANLLLLDEPSNDLDLSAIETLQETLEASEAAMVIVTHDRALARLAERVWAIEAGQLVEYRGGLDGYLAGSRRLEPGLEQVTPVADPDTSSTFSSSSPDPTPSEPEAGELERLELERLGVESRLDDPLRLGDRERQRLEQRRLELIDLLSLAYDHRLPAPLPAFSVREGSIRLAADLSEEGLSYGSEAPVVMRLIVHQGVGHLTLREPEGARLLPWARSALLDAAVRLAFYALAPRAVQHHSHSPVHSRLLEEGEAGWWSIGRERFEELEGWHQIAAEGSTPSGGEKSLAGRADRCPRRRRRRSRRATAPRQETG